MFDNDLEEIFICDPICFQQAGHNLAAIKRYSRYFQNKNIKTKIFVSRLLEKISNINLSKETNFFYSHYYGSILSSRFTSTDEKSKMIFDNCQDNNDQIIKDLALDELCQIISESNKKNNIGIFFPSIDYYSLHALVDILEKNKFVNLPKIYIRWIGVMENTFLNSNNINPLLLCRKLGLLNKSNNLIQMRFSAEAKPYARNLSLELKQEVITTPTFIDEDQKAFKDKNECFTISFPGSGRIDKGFLRIRNILLELESNYPELEYKAYLQFMNADEFNHCYLETRELLKNNNIRCYPTAISQKMLTEYIANSDILVTPYDPKIYLYRSSAIMAEAACYGRQVVSSADCGFSEELEELGVGKCAYNDKDFASLIYYFNKISSIEMDALVKKARSNYLNYLYSSYNNFFNIL